MKIIEKLLTMVYNNSAKFIFKYNIFLKEEKTNV